MNKVEKVYMKIINKITDMVKMAGYLVLLLLILPTAALYFQYIKPVIKGVTKRFYGDMLLYEAFQYVGLNILVMSYYMKDYNSSIFLMTTVVYLGYLSIRLLRDLNLENKYLDIYKKVYDKVNLTIIKADNELLINESLLKSSLIIFSILFIIIIAESFVDIFKIVNLAICIYIYFNLDKIVKQKLNY